MDMKNNLELIERDTMAQLKDFQCATVERIAELFCNGQNRVLVADEVGLGKTLIARGTIAKTALIQYEAGKKLFKIVYICSNQVIANQNIQKLDVFNLRSKDNTGESRLSMQHLKIAEQELTAKEKGSYAQLIPLTPSTSFSMTSGGGRKEERALMYVILSRIPKLYEYDDDLSSFLRQDVDGWFGEVEYYENRVSELSKAETGYPDNIIKRILEIDERDDILNELLTHLDELNEGYDDYYCTESGRSVLQKLRRMFAEISVGMLQPDLVILDEFQRFKFLIDSEVEETETGLLTQKFFDTKDLKVLLLSATPYKLYSTMDEIDEAERSDEYYKEFFDVIRFLNSDDNEKMKAFSEIWSDYSVSLREVIQGDAAVLSLKNKAEKELYNFMCRTERISVMDSGDYIDDSSTKNILKISEGDIHTFIDMGELLKKAGDERALLVDYAKSSPYLMSFMNHYKVKEYIEKYFKKNPDDIDKAKGKYLWINRNSLNHYDELPANNTRLEELKNQIFQNKSELYMWVPPSRPYYNLEGVYKDSKGFSKILVFSAWEMVPKMIGSMISYEEERRTVGVVSKNDKNKSTNNTYFTEAKLRYPVARLRFNVSKEEARGMYLLCLMYPSETLADIYHPIDYLNEGYTLAEIRNELVIKLDKLLRPIINEYAHESIREDNRWYYIAPALLDSYEYVKEWIDEMHYSELDGDENTDEMGSSGFRTHIDQFSELLSDIITKNIEQKLLGRAPSDLADVLADMAIGSFAICAYRSNGGDSKMASELAKVFINRFNATEATAAVILAFSGDEESDGDGHWRNVLRYCCDGGFGAMLDEYVHMVSEGAGFGLSEGKNKQIHETMMDALKIHSASYIVDTYPAFKRRMKGEKYQRTSMRSHYAVGFTKSDGDESKNVERKENLRNAFNSPMRPFVLATTSIGQEGLDFHQYCRKIMHWNLPGNPIDLEQREGRINRYKCLAIRQDLASRFSDKSFVSDVWQELFDMAVHELKEEGQSELVPYWCLGQSQKVKIERIIPMYPVSKDEVNYQRLIKVLSLYRLTMGQARQEELVNYLLENGFENDEYSQKLFINLSPYIRTNDKWRENMKNRKPVVLEKRKSNRQLRREKLEEELRNLNNELDEYKIQKSSLPVREIIGMKVKNKKFGEGIIVSEKNGYIYIKFMSGEKQFQMPKAFLGGFIVSEYDDFVEVLTAQTELEDIIEKLENDINEKTDSLENLKL